VPVEPFHRVRREVKPRVGVGESGVTGVTCLPADCSGGSRRDGGGWRSRQRTECDNYMNKAKERKIHHHVHVIKWPEESWRLKSCRMLNLPCILVVAPTARIPKLVAGREDWVRHPASSIELEERAALLLENNTYRYPTLDADGLLRFQRDVVALSPAGTLLVSALTCVPHRLVSREEMLHQLAEICPHPTDNSLNIHVLRLRRKLKPLGLHIETIRNRGYILRILNAYAEP
jgi:hypothetical protein